MKSGATSVAEHIRTLAGPTIHCAAVASSFVAEARSAAAAANFARFEIDLGGVETKAALLDCVARGMVFPSYFGRNWDALLDCLRDLSWVASDSYFLCIDGLDHLKARRAQDAGVFLEVLSSAVSYWRRCGWQSADCRPMFVLIPSESCASISEAANVATCLHSGE